MKCIVYIVCVNFEKELDSFWTRCMNEKISVSQFIAWHLLTENRVQSRNSNFISLDVAENFLIAATASARAVRFTEM